MRKRLMVAVKAAVLAAAWGVAHADVPDESEGAEPNPSSLAAEHAGSSDESAEQRAQQARLAVSARRLKGRPVFDADDVRIGTY